MILEFQIIKRSSGLLIKKDYPPASQASREAANLTERKNLHCYDNYKDHLGQGYTYFLLLLY